MAKKKRRHFPEEFKLQGVGHAETSGLRLSRVAVDLGVRESRSPEMGCRFGRSAATLPLGAPHGPSGPSGPRPRSGRCPFEEGTAAGSRRNRTAPKTRRWRTWSTPSRSSGRAAARALRSGPRRLVTSLPASRASAHDAACIRRQATARRPTGNAWRPDPVNSSRGKINLLRPLHDCPLSLCGYRQCRKHGRPDRDERPRNDVIPAPLPRRRVVHRTAFQAGRLAASSIGAPEPESRPPYSPLTRSRTTWSAA